MVCLDSKPIGLGGLRYAVKLISKFERNVTVSEFAAQVNVDMYLSCVVISGHVIIIINVLLPLGPQSRWVGLLYLGRECTYGT